MIYDHGFQFFKKSNNHPQNYQFLFVISWKPQGFWSLWTTKIHTFLVLIFFEIDNSLILKYIFKNLQLFKKLHVC
jgi:hypothetical protein